MFAESVYRVKATNKLEQYRSRKALQSAREITESRPKNQLFLKNEEDVWLVLSSVHRRYLLKDFKRVSISVRCSVLFVLI